MCQLDRESLLLDYLVDKLPDPGGFEDERGVLESIQERFQTTASGRES
jgi:hypothetical protein